MSLLCERTDCKRRAKGALVALDDPEYLRLAREQQKEGGAA